MNPNNDHHTHHHLGQQQQTQQQSLDMPASSTASNAPPTKVQFFSTAFPPLSPPLSHAGSPALSPATTQVPQLASQKLPTQELTESSSKPVGRRSSPNPHKLRSRSLPNLLKLDAFEQPPSPPMVGAPKHSPHHTHLQHTYRHRKHVNSHKKGSLAFAKPSSPSLLLHTPTVAASISIPTTSAHMTRPMPLSSSTSSSPFVYDLSMPLDLMPPVNTTSLREIDLQEIFKNPQLRHDIVFDPQLQFRPNLDGERGKRKRASTEKYWDTIVAELEALVACSDPSDENTSINANSKLPYLFVSMRDILDSLLPLKDRAYVDSVLDPELLLRQLRHCALDFNSLANWLSTVFKAHCAPMRDSWVDQMVARIESGIATRSARRVVEGLRMTFAILEAMKLDVANHQIRTLRPVLVDTAIEFEQGYYHQVLEKGKFSLEDSFAWYNKNLVKYTASHPDQKVSEIYRSAFCYGLTMLLSCASEDIVTEFPSSFGFDFARLADFRAEVRQIVCMHLCITLFDQLLQTRLAKTTTMTNPQRRAIFVNSKTPEEVEKMKTDIMAIIADAYGNTKWTKNTGTIALELARRVEIAVSAPLKTKRGPIVPDADTVDMASSWLSKYLQPKSQLYKIVESRVTGALVNISCKSMADLSALETMPSLSSIPSIASAEGKPNSVETAAKKEIESLAHKVLVLTRFHWGVFGKYYIAYATQGVDSSSENPLTAGDKSSMVSKNQQPASNKNCFNIGASSTSSASTTSANSNENEIPQAL